MEYNDCIEISEPSAITEKLNACKNELPVHEEDVKKLLDYHQLHAVMNFYSNHKELFAENKLMIRYYQEGGDAVIVSGSRVKIDGVGIEKELYFIDDSMECYFFFDEHDINLMQHSDKDRQVIYLKKYSRRMIRLSPPEMIIKRKLTDDIDDRELKKMRFTEENAIVLREHSEKLTTMSVELALVKQGKLHDEEKHRLEMEIIHSKYEKALQAKEIELLRLQQSVYHSRIQYNQVIPTSFIPTVTRSYIKRPITLEQWTSNIHYPEQDFTRIQPYRMAKWQGLRDNGRIIPHCIANLSFELKDGFPFLRVPMNFYCPMREILNLFLIFHEMYTIYFDERELDNLIMKCPEDYKIILHANQYENEEAMRFNAVNINTIIIHCQAIIIAYNINHKIINEASKEKENAKICLFNAQPDELHPSIEIYGEYHPLSTFYGPHSFISYGLGLRMRNALPIPKKIIKESANTSEKPRKGTKSRKSLPITEELEKDNDRENEKKKQKNKQKKSTSFGIGSGKCCALCLTRERIFIPTSPNEPQFTHQVRTCPILASLGNNEATILVTLATALNSHIPGNADRARRLSKKFIFTKPFNFNDSSLFRDATDEEIQKGEHVGGIRLNRALYTTMVHSVQKNMETQIKRSDIFGTPQYEMFNFVQTLLSPSIGQIKPDFKLSSLLISNDYNAFTIKQRFAEAGQQDLYFSLENNHLGPHTSNYIMRYNEELNNQYNFLGQNNVNLV